jgi:hypothetical protein
MRGQKQYVTIPNTLVQRKYILTKFEDEEKPKYNYYKFQFFTSDDNSFLQQVTLLVR